MYEDDILSFNLDYSFVTLSLTNDISYELTNRNLRLIEKILSDNFFRINRTTIVNLKKIKNVNGKEYEITMNNNKTYQISRREWSSFKRKYNILKNDFS